MPPKLKFSKEEIIGAAFHIVRTKGIKALTSRALGDALGSSARPIYSYFSSMSEVFDAVMKKAVAILYDDMTREKTGDPWLDHGIGYVMFALEEKNLFRALNDEDHILLFRKYGDNIWKKLTDSLSDYPPFQALTKEQIDSVQLHRWLFAHGLAFSASSSPENTWTPDNIVEVMVSGSMSLLTGLKSRHLPELLQEKHKTEKRREK